MFSAFVLPFVLYPLFLLGQSKLESATREGLEDDEVHFALASASGFIDLGGGSVPLAELEEKFAKMLPLEGPCSIERLTLDEVGEFESWNEGEGRAESLLILAANDTESESRALFEFYYDGSEDLANEAKRRARDSFRKLQREIESKRIDSLIGNDPGKELEYEVVDVASEEDQSGAALGRLLPLLLVLSIIAGGSMAALAAFAGERENGTLETLLVQPAPAQSLAWGKFAVVALTALGTLVANGASLLMCAALGIESSIFPEGTLVPTRLIVALFLFMPALVFLCAALTFMSSRARTFREGQQSLLPLTLIAALPSAVPLLPSADFNLFVAAIPIAGPALALRDVLTGNWNPGVALWMFAINSVWAGFLLRGIGNTLEAERLLATSGSSLEDAQRARFARNGLRYGFLSVFLVYVIGGALQAREPLSGLLMTLWVLVPLLAWFAARDLAREVGWLRAFGIVRPDWSRVLGALLCAPGLAMLMAKFFELQQKFMPLPASARSALESVTFLDELSTPALLFVIALSPGINEELLFRGAILQSLRRDLSSWKIVGWQALLFGLVHSSVFRFLPTAILGAILAVVTLRARSLWVAIVLHTAYNASAQQLQSWSADGSLSELAPILDGFGPEIAAGASALGVFLLLRKARTAPPGTL